MKRGREDQEEEERGKAAAGPDVASDSESNAPAAVRARLDGFVVGQASAAAAGAVAAGQASSSETAAEASSSETTAVALEPETAADDADALNGLPDAILDTILSSVGPEKALFLVCKHFLRRLRSGHVVWKDRDLVVSCSVEERDAESAEAPVPRGPLASLASASGGMRAASDDSPRGMLVGALAGVRRLALRFATRAPFLCGTQAGADLAGLLPMFRAGGGLARVEHLALEERVAPTDGFKGFGPSILDELITTSLSALSGASRLVSLAIGTTAEFSSLPRNVQWRGLLLGLRSLEALFLDGVEIDSDEAAVIAAALPKLRRLRAAVRGSSALEAVARCPRLEELWIRLWGRDYDPNRILRLPRAGFLALKRLALNVDGNLDLAGIARLAALTNLELHVYGATMNLNALRPLAPRLRELRLVLSSGAWRHLWALAPVAAALPASSKLHVALAPYSELSFRKGLAVLIRAGEPTLCTWEDNDRTTAPSPDQAELYTAFDPVAAAALAPWTLAETAAALAKCARRVVVTGSSGPS